MAATSSSHRGDCACPSVHTEVHSAPDLPRCRSTVTAVSFKPRRAQSSFALASAAKARRSSGSMVADCAASNSVFPSAVIACGAQALFSCGHVVYRFAQIWVRETFVEDDLWSASATCSRHRTSHYGSQHVHGDSWDAFSRCSGVSVSPETVRAILLAVLRHIQHRRASGR